MQRRRRRQLPVSCQLCRSMKLKCSRDQPCSNCASRGVTCERAYRVEPTTSSIASPSTTNPVQAQTTYLQPGWPANPSAGTDTGSNTEILSRLQRLEDIILRAHGAAAPRPSMEPSYISEGEGDSKWLEGVGTRDTSVLSSMSNGVSVRVLAVQQALETEISLGEASGNPSSVGSCVARVWLPPKNEATWLLKRYAEDVTYLHHILHLPSVRRQMEDLYKQLSLGLRIEPCHVALVLSIFASTAYTLTPLTGGDAVFTNEQTAVKCAFLWSKMALDVLEHSSRSTPGSIEDIQATIILSFVIFNFEGFTMRFRALSASALTMARDLSLHRLDARPDRLPGPHAPLDSDIGREIKRRVWWHMVSTDWILALSGGPQEGTYLMHPAHMRVNYPRNLDDRDLDRYNPQYSRPLSQPTAMTYTLLRIQLADICRSAIDALPPPFSDWGEVNYDRFISLDQRFEAFIRSLPVFFRLDEASRHQSRDVEHQYPQIIVQRYILWSTLQGRRSKLNQPFLTRVSMNPRYEYSRKVCLQSARCVIELKALMDHDMASLASAHVRLATFLHTYFLATAVLVMDLCLNKEGGSSEDRRQEIVDACRVLQEAEATSPMASRFLKSLMDILQKYQIQVLPATTVPDVRPLSANNGASGVSDPDLSNRDLVNPSQILPSTYDPLENANIDDLWQNFINLDQNCSPGSWDHLFSALDSRIV
ncbi:hypothetical protein BDV34DRAFT_196715 [Aspergillus parasiticus]|uniref:Zn(2)-C6 fungal-type domain-containing protein n=1 Tax=Aspergillus parasiticus TaxID=5067 RepID=A0A5N6DIG6_ASPPA|nr:hypothetical protein BDV34DRAFT_196715 [Aspergillus parasiticus]